MKYSKEEIIQYVQEEDVKFIRLAFAMYLANRRIYPLCLRNFLGLLNMVLPLMHLQSQVLETKRILICSFIQNQTL